MGKTVIISGEVFGVYYKNLDDPRACLVHAVEWDEDAREVLRTLCGRIPPDHIIVTDQDKPVTCKTCLKRRERIVFKDMKEIYEESIRRAKEQIREAEKLVRVGCYKTAAGEVVGAIGNLQIVESRLRAAGAAVDEARRG